MNKTQIARWIVTRQTIANVDDDTSLKPSNHRHKQLCLSHDFKRFSSKIYLTSSKLVALHTWSQRYQKWHVELLTSTPYLSRPITLVWLSFILLPFLTMLAGFLLQCFDISIFSHNKFILLQVSVVKELHGSRRYQLPQSKTTEGSYWF